MIIKIKITFRLKGANLIDEKSIDYRNLIESEIFQNEYLSLANDLKSVCLDTLIEKDTNTTNENITSFFISILFY